MSMTYAYGYSKQYRARFVTIGLILNLICSVLIFKYTALIPAVGLMVRIIGATTFASTFLIFMAFRLMQPAFRFDDETISYLERQRNIKDMRGVEVSGARLKILFRGSQTPLTVYMSTIDGAEDMVMRLRARLQGETAPIIIN